jgi:microcystin degradation protein MlrC
MRIGIAQLWQESNTFNPLPTTRAEFESFGLMRGDEFLAKMAETNEPGGFIQSLRKWPEKPELVGLVRLPAWPSGTATRETFDWIHREIVEALEKAGPLDALLVALHGAMVSEDRPDVEGEILTTMRQMVGAKLPLVATLDLHANVTRRMVAAADALVLYHTAPHVDVFETGVRGAAVLRRILVDGVRPTKAMVKIPAVVPAERANTQDRTSASYEFRRELQALEARPEILTAGLATVQPWLDIPEFGSCVLVTTVGDADLAGGAAELAQREAERIAGMVWNHRRDYLATIVPLEQAVREAHECREGLVVLGDPADATTAGAPGDSTWVLSELLKYDWPRGALITMVAPDVVAAADRLAPGAALKTAIGGKRDTRFCKPIDVTAVVERTFDAAFTLNGHLGRNMAIEMGRSALLKVGDVRIVVTSLSGPHFAPELFQLAGLDPFAQNVLIAKSPCGFRAAYAPRAAKILLVGAPGCAPSEYWKYSYERIPRPLWPWDEFEWTPQAELI